MVRERILARNALKMEWRATSLRALSVQRMGRHTLIVSVEPVPMMMPAMNVRMLARPQSPMAEEGVKKGGTSDVG